jgi:hypothetical protein
MNPLIAALLAAGVISDEEARTLNGLLNEGATRIEAEQRVAAAFATGFENQRSRLIRALDMGNVDYRDPMLPTFWAAEHELLARDVLPTLTGIAQDVALTATVRSGGLADWRTVNEAVIAWTDTHYRSVAGDALGSIPNLDNTARDAVADAVNRWQRGELNAGPGPMGLPRLIAELQNVEEFGVDRAARIAVTETTRIFAESERTAAQANPNMEYLVWQTSSDEATCLICAPMEGQRIPKGQATFPGGYYPPAHPNCIVGGTIVSSPSIEATFKRWYAGDVVEIRTEGGNFLTVTPNHPVLTDKGWIEAGALNVGNNVISSRDSETATAFVDPNDYNRPALIEDVVETFGRAAGMASVSVPTTPVDFHGDGMNGNVEIVRADSLLQRGVSASFFEPCDHLPLVSGDVRLSALSANSAQALFSERNGTTSDCFVSVGAVDGVLFGSSGLHHKTISAGAVSRRDTFAQQPSADYCTIDPEFFSECIFRFAREVAGSNGMSVESVSSDVAFALTSGKDSADLRFASQQSALGDLFSQTDGSEMPCCGGIVKTLSIYVVLDRILEVNRRRFCGHVYNLQTKTGWYIANNIITHNCRCGVTAVTEVAAEVLSGAAVPAQVAQPVNVDRVVEMFSGNTYREFNNVGQINKFGSYYEPWANGLAQEERAALVRYQEVSFGDINMSLRGQASSAGNYQSDIAQLDSAMGKAQIPHNAIVYRGLKGTPNMQVGDSIMDSGFVSTTCSRNAAENYLHQRAGDTLFEVKVKRGQTGLYMDAVSSKEEYELLLPRGSQFRIIGQRTDTVRGNPITIFEMELDQ